MRRVRLAVIGMSMSVLAFAPALPEADACGAFFPQKTKVEDAPSLSLERTLIVFDAAKRTEHFVREVVFRGGAERFGFVVPTPTRPEVAKVTGSPFEDLERRFPFDPTPAAPRGGNSLQGAKQGVTGSASVVVVEVKYLGSFTAFVLKATDAGALAKWLSDNDLASSPEGDRWLAEYVARDFFYVALRYEPALDSHGERSALRAETMRISFPTPVAYYPYREPAHAKSGGSERAASLWVVSTEPLVPVALVADARGPTWVRPFVEGERVAAAEVEAVRGCLDATERALLPAAERLVVQTFQDQKSQRLGYGDVVFLPAAGLAAERLEAAETFVKSTLLPRAGETP